MARIEGIRIKNFRALRDVTIGKLWNLQNAESLTPTTTVIGKNGVGKSSLFDAFGFLADCLRSGVEKALTHNFVVVHGENSNLSQKFSRLPATGSFIPGLLPPFA